jgi:hypothetical protein
MKARMAKKLKRAADSRWGNLMKKTTKKSELSHEEWAAENPVSLVFHSSQHSLADLLVNIETLPEVEVDDILQIMPVGLECQPILLQVTEASLEAAKTKAITLSMSNLAAAAFGLSHVRQIEVNVRKAPKEAYSVDWIQLSIKDQNINRRDQWLFTKNAVGLAVFKTQRLQIGGVKAQVFRILTKGQPMTCGVVTSKTKLVYASKSCAALWLIELSREMWEVADDGFLYIEKAIEFLRTMFERCLLNGTSHYITVAWYARALYPQVSPDDALSAGLQRLSNGTAYQDVYKTVVELSDIRLWRQAMLVIKRELFFAPALLNWQDDLPKAAQRFLEHFPMSKYAEELRLSPSSSLKFTFHPEACSVSQMPSRLAQSHRSNCLEAVNFSLDNFSSFSAKANYTGQRIVAVSAGPGVYFTEASLHKVTKERVMISGCCVNLISLRRRPMHATPLLVYNWESRDEEGHESDLYLVTDNPQSSGKSFSFPYWLTVHYFYYFTQLEGTAGMQGALHDVNYDRTLINTTCMVHTSLKTPPLKTQDVLLVKPFTAAESTIQGPSVRSAVRAFCKAHDTRVGSCDLDRPLPLSGLNSPKLPDKAMRPNHLRLTLSKDRLHYSEDSPEYFSDLVSEFGSQHSGKVGSDWHPVGASSPLEAFNPFNLSLPRVKLASLKRRWDHVFPHENKARLQGNDLTVAGTGLYSEAFLKQVEELWQSLVELNLFPLTTDSWPRSDQLGEGQPYQLFIQTGQERDSIIDELVAARLKRDFQLVSSESEKHGRSRYLSQGLHFHIIIPSESDDYNIEFRTYVRKQPSDGVTAACLMFDPRTGGFTLKRSTFSLSVFNDWTATDSQILGH